MLNDTQRAQLIGGAAVWGIGLDTLAVKRFERFTELLLEWNQRLNLTRVPLESFVTLHFLDSLSGVPTIVKSGARTLIDIGTGAGFPGIPIALALPNLKVTLMDSTRKRLEFINLAIGELGLTGVRTQHARAEEIDEASGSGNRYDVATARAVARMPTLAGWLMPHVKRGGMALAYKSSSADQEVAEAQSEMLRQGIACEEIQETAIPYSDIVRKLVVLRHASKRS